MKMWKMLFLVLLLGFMFTGVSLLAREKGLGNTKDNFLNDSFKIALKDDDDDDDDKEMVDDDEDDDKDMDDDDGDEELPAPKTMEELWQQVFKHVKGVDQDAALKFYKANFPFVFEKAQRLLRVEPGEAVDVFVDEFREYREILEDKDEEPEEFKDWVEYKKNEFKSFQLAEKIRGLARKKQQTDEDKAAITKDTGELKSVLGIMFQLRLADQKREIEELRGEIKELESTITKREASREKIIERKLNQMLGKEDDMEW